MSMPYSSPASVKVSCWTALAGCSLWDIVLLPPGGAGAPWFSCFIDHPNGFLKARRRPPDPGGPHG
jgi:hypothetical protein